MGWSHWDVGGGGSGVNNTTNYAYDSLNRLTQATMASHYTQNYNYDRYGNMVCSGNYCNATVAFDSTTNHITGFGYDAAGNLTADGTVYGTHSFQWDAEGRMVSVDGVAGQACQSSWTDCFTYNPLGQRVQKHVGSPASDTYYYYDAFGNLAMTKGASQVKEYLFPGNFGKYYWTGSAWETDYTHVNPLGSTQVVTRADGNPVEEEIFFPFGGMRWHTGGTQDVRYASMQERDLETQTWQDPLDPTPNRTYTSGLGRWFSPDPVGGDVSNPQSLNRYAYALNNPTALADPSGLGPNPPPAGEVYANWSRACMMNPDCAEWYSSSGPWPSGIAPPTLAGATIGWQDWDWGPFAGMTPTALAFTHPEDTPPPDVLPEDFSFPTTFDPQVGGGCGQQKIAEVVKLALHQKKLSECLNKIFGAGTIVTNKNLPTLDTRSDLSSLAAVGTVSDSGRTVYIDRGAFYDPASSAKYLAAAYTHELGNALAIQIYGSGWAKPAAPSVQRLFGLYQRGKADRDTGANLENCVFRGYVFPNGDVLIGR